MSQNPLLAVFDFSLIHIHSSFWKYFLSLLSDCGIDLQQIGKSMYGTEERLSLSLSLSAFLKITLQCKNKPQPQINQSCLKLIVKINWLSVSV